ncbi:sigma 54-interacting transcriptional regulator [Desulfovibrio sp. OttesenSCG-928-O18]|nr:sigma 54-interacting transcriptional regulator [Desulfovibrio sp. OttesenSCG-928-O18]
MISQRKSILFVSLSQHTSDYHVGLLNDIFRNEVDVFTYALYDKSSTLPSGDFTIVLAAGTRSYNKCLDIFPAEKVMFSTREVSFPTFLDRVLRLPPGKRVLLVCETEEVSKEITLQLLQHGVNHIDYVPYWNGCARDVRDIDTALTPGMPQYVPAHIKTVIDMQRRPLALSVILDMIEKLELDRSYIDRYILANSKQLYSVYKSMSECTFRNIMLESCLAEFVSAVDDTVMVTDDEVVTYCSDSIVNFIGLPKSKLIGKRITEFFKVALADEGERRDAPLSGTLTRENNAIACTCRIFDDLHDGSSPRKLYKLLSVKEGKKTVQKRTVKAGDGGHVARYRFSDIITESDSAAKSREQAISMARSHIEAPILILGESGTGKEMFAQSIHNASARSRGPFVAVNFGAIPETLVESELFGYERGAFTGAHKGGKRGLFELANNGTIFLDEITNAPTMIQARLLRVLEEKSLMRVGGVSVVPVDVRVITATNSNMGELMAKGLFREDLYHRLSSFTLHLPPLRERMECLRPLILTFMEKRGVPNEILPEVWDRIYAYSWPGNVRQLKNAVDYFTLKTDSGPITLADVPHFLRERPMPERLETVRGAWPDASLQTQVNITLLRVFQDNASRTPRWGRKKIMEHLERQGIPLSAGQYRELVAELARQGLVSIGKTKQGCVITEEGRRFLVA